MNEEKSFVGEKKSVDGSLHVRNTLFFLAACAGAIIGMGLVLYIVQFLTVPSY